MNSRGLRDVEHSLSKPPYTYRIVVLGDSYAEALQVRLEDSFPRLLESMLQNRIGTTRRIEVINLGVSGFGTDQELLALRHYGLSYDPDLVILAFLTGNDVRNNYPSLETAANGKPNPKPYFVLDERGRLVLKRPLSPEQTPLWKRIGSRFYTYNWISERIERLRLQQKGPVDNGVYLARYSPEWKNAWRVTEALIAEIARESASAGAKFLLVSLTDPMQLSPRQGPSLDTEKPVRILRDIARRQSIEYLPLLPRFKEAMKANGWQLSDLHFPCDGHWTPLGHRLAAEAITERVYSAFLGG